MKTNLNQLTHKIMIVILNNYLSIILFSKHFNHVNKWAITRSYLLKFWFRQIRVEYYDKKILHCNQKPESLFAILNKGRLLPFHKSNKNKVAT
jgi:hypothetical protein